MPLIEIFKNEHMISYQLIQQLFKQRLEYLVDQKVVAFDPETQMISRIKDSKNGPIIRMFVEMASVFVDTYLTVGLAIEQICGKNVTLKPSKLVEELSLALKTLHSQKVLPHLHSSLQEIIETALGRFEELQLL